MARDASDMDAGRDTTATCTLSGGGEVQTCGTGRISFDTPFAPTSWTRPKCQFSQLDEGFANQAVDSTRSRKWEEEKRRPVGSQDNQVVVDLSKRFRAWPYM